MMRPPSHRRGFTLIEAMAALTLVTILAAALLARFGDEGRFVADALDETVAEGMALQLMNEVAGCRYVEPGQSPLSTSLGRDASEGVGLERYLFDDVDDFHGYSASPPVDRYGVPLGTEDAAGTTRHANYQAPAESFSGWRESVAVYFVDDANPTVRLAAGTPSYHKLVEIVISYNDPRQGTVELARLSRVFAYVPTP